MTDSPAAGNPASGIPEEAVAAEHEHRYHALWAHPGPHGRQDIHYHPCTEDEDEPWSCVAVLVGYGQQCDGEAQHHVRSGLPLPDDLAVPGEPDAVTEVPPLRAEDDPLLQMMAKAVPMVPRTDIAEAVAAERERAEALIVQAQDYASAESERAGKLAALALKALNQCHALERDDSAAYLDEWSMALDQLEGAAGEMSPPDSDPLEEANQAGIRWERERIISLASQLRASFPADHPKGAQASFADYLRVRSAGAGEDGNEPA